MWSLWWDQLFLLLPKHSKHFGSFPKCAQYILTCTIGVCSVGSSAKRHLCMQHWPWHLTSVFAPYCVDLGGIQHEFRKCRLAAPEPRLFLPSSLKRNRWKVCKYTEKDVICYLLSLPVKCSLPFAIFTRGSRNIRTVKKVLLAGLGAVPVKVARCLLLYNPVFSCLWLFITLHFRITFSLLGVCLR